MPWPCFWGSCKTFRAVVAAGLAVNAVPERIDPGDLCFFEVTFPAEISPELSGRLGDLPLSFAETGRGHWLAIGAADLEIPAGSVPLYVEARSGDTIRRWDGRVEIRAKDFGIQRLSLPPDKVVFPPDILRRVLEEKERLDRLTVSASPRRLWEGAFDRPMPGPLSGDFGLRRILNGEPRDPHAGVDFPARVGTSVRSPNRGRVAYIGEHYLSGKTLALDHGLGLYTLYFHLDKVLCAQDAMVKKGEIVGLSGRSGRSTGAHLHWAARFRGARVDPRRLFDGRLGGIFP